MRFKASYILLLFLSASLIFWASCRKQQQLTVGGALSFSEDTLEFDTVFTAAGSYTTGLLIYNTNSQEIVISSVRLAGGAQSYFALNVDGFKGNNVSNLKIAPHDSIYVFATVNIDPNNDRTPFVVTDSLVATLNGTDYFVPFTAYGQNARYLVDTLIPVNSTWDTLLPYVLINSAGIGPGATLTIPAGTKIYMHQNSGFVVYGTLLANGTKKDSVIFQGDRLDRKYFGYEGYPGEWGGIYFDSRSNGSKLTYTRLENCGNGALGRAAAIWLAPDSVNYNSPTHSPSGKPQLTLDRCIIKNSIGNGILSFQGTVVATNCLVAATGGEALAIVRGGYDSMVNCTFANYGGTGLTHATRGTVAILDYFSFGDGTWESGSLNATLRNCIVYGSLDSEIICSSLPGAASTQVRLNNCLLKIGTVRESFVQFTDCIYNQDPLFVDATKGDYHLKEGSPAIGAGSPSLKPAEDLDGKIRDRNDIGCYKY